MSLGNPNTSKLIFLSVKAVNKFMDKNGLLSLIRAHEA